CCSYITSTTFIF
nr:immunoglobulin light chain junction region [Macaca mulatta]